MRGVAEKLERYSNKKRAWRDGRGMGERKKNGVNFKGVVGYNGGRERRGTGERTLDWMSFFQINI